MSIRTIVISLLLLLFSVGATAQSVDVRAAFLESPDYVIPALGQAQKQDLMQSVVDGKSSGEAVQNIYGGDSRVLEMTKDYLHIALDSLTDLQIKLLPLVNNTSLICMVATSTIAPQQSVVLFYDAVWQQIPSADLFVIPELQAFLLHPSQPLSPDVKTALTEIGNLNYHVQFEPNLPQATVRITSFDAVEMQRQHPDVKQFLRPDGVRLTWEKSRFVIQEVH